MKTMNDSDIIIIEGKEGYSKHRFFKRLGKNQLIVASVTLCGENTIDWSAYIGCYHMGNPEIEYTDEDLKQDINNIAEHGDKIDEDLAKMLFPHLKQFRWRN